MLSREEEGKSPVDSVSEVSCSSGNGGNLQNPPYSGTLLAPARRGGKKQGKGGKKLLSFHLINTINWEEDSPEASNR